jgi:hypothetical protein
LNAGQTGMRPGGLQCSTSGAPPNSSCQISGLVDGETYVFDVTASNASQTGPAARSNALYVGTGVDLTVSLRKIGDTVEGQPLRYAIDVVNNGSQMVDGIEVITEQIRGLESVSWQCVGPAPCNPASGSDVVETFVGLGVGQTATIEIVGDPIAGQPFVRLVASASLPAGNVLVVRTEDDRAVLIDRVSDEGIFLDGFEQTQLME